MTLPNTQRWFAEIVMRPLTAKNQMQIVGEDGRELAEIDSIIAPNSKLSAFERLEVYNRQYWFRLFETLDTDFPALVKLVGKKRFHDLAESYIRDCPSQSYTLRDLGGRLPDWLAANSEKAGEHREASVDIAKLEWAYVEAFDAAELPPAKPEDLAAVGEHAKLRLQPHIRFVDLRTAIDEFTAKAHENEFARREKQFRRFGKDRFTPTEPFTIVVYRNDDQVAQLPLDKEAVSLLRAINDGKALGDALESAFLDSTIPAELIAPKIQEWFALWAGLGWFTVAG